MKLIIGYEHFSQVVKAAAVIREDISKEYLAEDVLDMLRSGLTVNCIETENPITIGYEFHWDRVKRVNL